MKLYEITGIEPDWESELLNEADRNLPMPKLRIGVEVELEGVHPDIPSEMDSIYWETTPEQSLRGSDDGIGIEFRFKQPMFGKDIRAAFDEFEEMFEEQAPHCGNRCSTHIHFDVRNLDIEDVQKIFSMYTILERVLFHYDGSGREDNFYCVPVYKMNNKNIQKHLHELLNNDYNRYRRSAIQKAKYKQFLDSYQKYGAVNLRSVRNIGSIEFRMMRAMYKSDELWEWVYLLQSIMKYAMDMGPLDKLPIDISMKGVKSFLEEVFGPEAAQDLMYDDLDIDVFKGIRVAQELIYTDGIDVDIADQEEGELSSIRERFIERNRVLLAIPNKEVIGPREWFEIDDEREDIE